MLLVHCLGRASKKEEDEDPKVVLTELTKLLSFKKWNFNFDLICFLTNTSLWKGKERLFSY
jgi:hypothetical protein